MKADLKTSNSPNPVITWFGHSSYLIQIDDISILVDPTFSGYASPFSFTGKCFEGSNIYSTDDLPVIDLLIITHDHYDHLDYKTLLNLGSNAKLICTSLAVSAHLRYWGFESSRIIEFDWWDSRQPIEGITLTAAPARHFSGRTFSRNKTLWSSFILKTEKYNFYIGGDSGYDAHFKTIGDQSGPFDMAMLECGQYNAAWPFIHMMPEQTVHAARDLKAKMLMPVHWGKFSLSLHPWDEPIKRLVVKAIELNQPITTPMIGEPIIVDEHYPENKWWLAI